MRVWLPIGVISAVIAAAISVPLVASADAHDQALARYRSAASALPGESSRLDGALAGFDATHDDLSRIGAIVEKLRATPAGTLLATQHAALDEASVEITSALALAPGEQPTGPEAAASTRSTTDELASAAVTLEQQERREQTWLSTTEQSARAAGIADAVAAAVLDALVTGTPADGDQPALPGLGDAASAALALYPRADQPAKDAVTAAVAAARVAADARASVDAELLAYADRVQAAHASQDAADAAAAAAAAQAAAAQVAAARAAGAESTGSSNSGSGSSSGGGGQTGWPNPAPPPVFRNHVPKVTPEGAYTPGCSGTATETLQSGEHGMLLITLDFAYPYAYSTFTTADGWGLTVIECD